MHNFNMAIENLKHLLGKYLAKNLKLGLFHVKSRIIYCMHAKATSQKYNLTLD